MDECKALPLSAAAVESHLSHTDQGRAEIARHIIHYTGSRAKAWCLNIHAEASLSHGGQGESLEPPHTEAESSLSPCKAL